MRDRFAPAGDSMNVRVCGVCLCVCVLTSPVALSFYKRELTSLAPNRVHCFSITIMKPQCRVTHFL